MRGLTNTWRSVLRRDLSAKARPERPLPRAREQGIPMIDGNYDCASMKRSAMSSKDVRKIIQGDHGWTTFGPVQAPFDVVGNELRYRGRLRGFVDVLERARTSCGVVRLSEDANTAASGSAHMYRPRARSLPEGAHRGGSSPQSTAPRARRRHASIPSPTSDSSYTTVMGAPARSAGSGNYSSSSGSSGGCAGGSTGGAGG